MSDEEAHDAFRLIRWAETKGEAVCPRCACSATNKITTRRLWKCKACARQFSVTSGTIFASRKLPIGTYLLAIAIFVKSFDQAILSAVDNVRALSATVARVEPDRLVSHSYIAHRVDMMRAAMSQYANGQRRSGFPSPVAQITSERPLYQWHAVAEWFCLQGKLPEMIVRQASTMQRINAAIFYGRADVRAFSGFRRPLYADS